MPQLKGFVIFAAAATLAACATHHAVPPPSSAPVAQNDKVKIPPGYKLMMVGGQSRYCKKDIVTGSALQTSYVCLSPDQLNHQQNQDFVDDYLRQQATFKQSPTPTGR